MVVVSVTLLRPYFSFLGMWNPAKARVRRVYAFPFEEFVRSRSFVGTVIDAVANFLFFVPLGAAIVLSLAALLGTRAVFSRPRTDPRSAAYLWRPAQHVRPLGSARRVRRYPLVLATVAAFVLSTGIELSQYVFRLGFTDIDDVILNTLGAAVGAHLVLNGRASHDRWWVAAILVAAAAFVTVVVLQRLLG